MNIKTPNNVRYNLLIILEKDGNIENINNIGYSYEDISKLINLEIVEGNVKFTNNKFQLTDSGLELKKDLVEKLKYSNIEHLISPQISDIIENKSDIMFIPDINELPD